jgi:hypothetical protein
MTSSQIVGFREKYTNRAVGDMVLNNSEMIKILKSGETFLRKDTPVYQIPASKTGRAQFYSSVKRVGHTEIPTLWFNVIILWIMTFLLYLMLLDGTLKKIIRISENR